MCTHTHTTQEATIMFFSVSKLCFCTIFLRYTLSFFCSFFSSLLPFGWSSLCCFLYYYITWLSPFLLLSCHLCLPSLSTANRILRLDCSNQTRKLRWGYLCKLCCLLLCFFVYKKKEKKKQRKKKSPYWKKLNDKISHRY